MNHADAIQKKRLTTMFAIDVVCFVLAGAAVIGYVAAKIDWLAPVFIGAIAVGLGAQIWFILGWMKAAKRDEEGKAS
jgi:1,4-dihydroxy-2-naphthoate octaprenyltransferase